MARAWKNRSASRPYFSCDSEAATARLLLILVGRRFMSTETRLPQAGHTSVALRASTLARLPDSVARPGYDRSRTVSRLVHFGVGGFNRSHLAVYLDDLLSRE